MYSLVKFKDNVPESKDFKGSTIRKPTFMGDDEVLIKSLITYVYNNNKLEENQVFSNNSIIKNHIDNGIINLWKIYENSDKNINLWYEKLNDTINKNKINHSNEKVKINIGKDIFSNEQINLELNNSNIHPNSHLAIIGKPGVGKTQFLLKILTDIRKSTNYKTNIIAFDYKGDISENKNFIELNKLEVFKLLQDENSQIPINPFSLKNYKEQDLKISAREKAESFSSINKSIGIVQKGYLQKAIINCYENRKNENYNFPDFKEVLNEVLRIYEEEGKKEDTLTETLRDLAEFDLFWSHDNDIELYENIHRKSFVVDLHSMPVLKELVAYLVIEKLYKEMSKLPDSRIVNGQREIRTILVIDEAHNYLSQKNIFLQKIIREGRSKGIAVFFASQSPNDYQQKFFNFQELLEFAFIFQSDGFSSNAIKEILGIDLNTAKNLSLEISKLKPFEAIMKSKEIDKSSIKFEAAKFFESYK
jgi:energy-coupling factor transporter ATP-binding protein EcfA2